jgi:hypothetical protein
LDLFDFIFKKIADGLRSHAERHHVRHHSRDLRHPGAEPNGDGNYYSRSAQALHASRYSSNSAGGYCLRQLTKILFFLLFTAYAEEIPFTKPAPIDELELKKQQQKKK